MNQRYTFKGLLPALLILLSFPGYSQCLDPAPSVINISNDSVTVSWAAVTSAIGYEYVVQDATLPQPSVGTPTTSTTIGVSSLPYMAHKAWVRTDCGTSTLSNWVSIAFTIVCSKPGAVNVTNITDTSADMSWTQVTGINEYEYVLDNNSADPSVAGTNITATSYNATGLQAGMDYYMHVRSHCGAGGTMSSWTTEHFATMFPVSVANTAAKEIIKAYPNPVKDVVHIQLPQHYSAGNIIITDVSGKVVKQLTAEGNAISIDMQPLNKGLYILKYVSKESTAYTRIVKQ